METHTFGSDRPPVGTVGFSQTVELTVIVGIAPTITALHPRPRGEVVHLRVALRVSRVVGGHDTEEPVPVALRTVVEPVHQEADEETRKAYKESRRNQ